MKTEIRKVKSADFEPFEIIIHIENSGQADVILHMVQRELNEQNELRAKIENELKRQGWEL